MNIYEGCSSHLKERGDCTVRALARCFEIPYDKAHSICKKNGRKDSCGFWLDKVFKLSRTRRKSRVFLGKRLAFHGLRKKVTVAKFVKKHPMGTYLCHRTRHAFSIIDGVVYDQHNLNQRIDGYYYISKSKSNDSTSGQQVVDDTEAVRSEAKSNQASCENVDNAGQVGL